MKPIVALILCLIGTTASAECYMRSSIVLSRQTITGSPTDIQRMVVPDVQGQKCVARYRVYLEDTWRTVEGTGVGATESQACEQAMQTKNGFILSDAEPTKVQGDSQIICSDMPDIRIRPVKRGETIWESETDLHSHPLERANPYFKIKHAKCRKFIERVNKNQNLIIYQGIICQKDTSPMSKWVVIDKY